MARSRPTVMLLSIWSWSPRGGPSCARAHLVWPSWRLTLRQLCDLELLANGGFSPLQTFLGPDDYAAVCHSMRLADGSLWPIPIVLDLPESIVQAAEHDWVARSA